MWPISPPAPLNPDTSIPFTYIPPPIPVPSATVTLLLLPFAAPYFASPNAMILASLSNLVSIPVIFSSFSFTFTLVPHGKFAKNATIL